MQYLLELFVKVWNETFIGVSVGQLAVAVFVFFFFLLLRRFFARVVISRLKSLANKTKTDVDDRILAALHQPLMFLFLILGLSFIYPEFSLREEMISYIRYYAMRERILVFMILGNYRQLYYFPMFLKHMIHSLIQNYYE